MFLCAGLCIFFVAVFFENIENEKGFHSTYQQHLSSKREDELGEKPLSDGLVTHLPIIIINTDGQKIPGRGIIENGLIIDYETTNGMEYVVADMAMINNEDNWNSEEQTPAFESDITIHIRGNSSRAFDKPGYRIELIKDKNPELKNKVSLLDMAKSSSYVLHGPFLDKTLIRNYVFMNIGNMITGYESEVRFCELVLNGEYQGLYVLMETIDVGKGKLDLREYRKNEPICSYVVQINTSVSDEKQLDNFTYYTDRLTPKRQFEIVHPGNRNLDENAINYIKTDLSEIERKLYSYTNLDDDDFYVDYIDEDSFVDYYIYEEFLGIYDMYNASTYFYKDARGKLHIGPFWDFNNALDNFFNPIKSDVFLLNDRGVYKYLFTSKRFTEKVIDRYHELRETVLSDEYIRNYCDEVVEYLGSAVDRNYELWGYSFDAANMPTSQRKNPYQGDTKTRVEDINPESYDEAFEMMFDYMQKRGAFLDEHIENLRQYYSYSKNASKVVH